jgi:putative transcriptional regulator
MTKRYKSDLKAALHETVEGLHRIGLVDKKTMREFDESCLTSVERLSPREIQALREREGVSQKVFARYLNVPVTLISQWERGERKPSGAAVKLLSVVKHKGLEAIA